ncbi:MAG: Zn-ribbon domain-containing OB-fold protein [Acidimicrobiia bacterium]
MAAPRFDLPTPDADTQPFWDGCRDGKLLVKQCGDCNAVHYYPRSFCPSCWSENVDWLEVSGTGTLYTYSVVRRNDLPPFNERTPYVAAIVELDEGPRIMTNIVDTDFDALQIGMRVQAKFQAISDDVTIPVFAPAG